MSFLFNIMAAVFKPSLIALTIAFGVAIISFGDNPNTVSTNTIDLSEIGCPSILNMLCGDGGPFR